MTTGRFVWYELLTTDPKAAIAFYSEVVGWRTELFPETSGPEPYNMWVASQGPLGGVMTLPEPAKKMGTPPHWMAHVEVANIDATVAKVKELRGTVHVPPTPIPKVGRFSVIADPQGASLSVFQPDQPMQSHDRSKHGEFIWSELVTTDHKSAFKFYGALFGWQRLSGFEMTGMGEYLIFGQGGDDLGGMFTKSAQMPMPPSWAYYIHVDDLEATISRATSTGAKLMNGPMELPESAGPRWARTRVAQLTDPQGAFFALHGPALRK
jgi:predicted enzyme related to lactoylglutathione lyase